MKLIGNFMLTLVFLSAYSVKAENIYISGSVLAWPSCIVNNNQTIAVSFGDVKISQLDGKQHEAAVVYALECKNAPSNAMRLKIQGVPASFNAQAIQTSIVGLGIELRANGERLMLNNWLNFTYPYKPELKAVPVRNPVGELSTGAFSAGATLLVDYQ